MILYDYTRTTANIVAKKVVLEYGRNVYWMSLEDLMYIEYDKLTDKEIEDIKACIVKQVERVTKFMGV